MKVIILAAVLATAAAQAPAQVQFQAGGVEIKQRALRASDVRAFLNRQDYKNAKDIALQCFKETDDAWCAYYAGSLTFGAPGLQADEAEGLRLVQWAADRDVSSAQVFLGNLHFNGSQFPKSAPQAIAWWTRAANNCNAWAQNALARTYFDGEHAPANPPEAYYWVSLAAYYRFPNAARGVEVIGERLSAAQRKQAEERRAVFIQRSACGTTAAKPVVHDDWSN